jgi:hypothetical protein
MKQVISACNFYSGGGNSGGSVKWADTHSKTAPAGSLGGSWRPPGAFPGPCAREGDVLFCGNRQLWRCRTMRRTAHLNLLEQPAVIDRYRCGAISCAQHAKDRSKVDLDGTLTDPQGARYTLIGTAHVNMPHDLLLAGR